MPRSLTLAEIDELLHGDHVARLATIDTAGYPHVTPLWFLWVRDAFYLASDTGRPHVARIRANRRVGLVIDAEDPERPDGERPNRQVRVVGNAELHADADGEWSRRIWAKYRSGQPDPDALAKRLHDRDRTHILINRTSSSPSPAPEPPCPQPQQAKITRADTVVSGYDRCDRRRVRSARRLL